MTNVPCVQCGSLNLLAAESCQQCGAELHHIIPATEASAPHRTTAEYGEDPNSQYAEFTTGPEIGAFTGVSSVLDPTMTLCKDNFWLIAKIVFLIFAPFEIFKALSLPYRSPSWQVSALTFGLWLVCNVLAAPALIYALMKVMRTGVAPSVNEAYRFGLGKIGSLMIIAVMAWTLEMIGFACLVIPGIILSLAFQIIYPIGTLETLSPVAALKRSYNLTKGHRGNIFLVGLVLTLLLSVVNIPVSIVVMMLPDDASWVWLARAGGALVSDILNEANTVMSLVIYLSIMKGNETQLAPVNLTPPPPSVFEERST